MPSHKLHRKWAEECGINGDLANEVDRIIDDMSHHDSVKVMITNMIAMEAVVRLIRGNSPEDIKESLLRLSKMFPNNVRKYAKILFTDRDTTGMKVIKEIYDTYGVEGLKAAILHVVLDYIEQLYLRGYDIDEIKRRIGLRGLLWGASERKGERISYLLEEAGFKECITRNIEIILRDIKFSKPPSKAMEKDLKVHQKVLNYLKSRDIVAIVINGFVYSLVPGVRRLNSILKKQGIVRVGLVKRKHRFKEKILVGMPTDMFYNEEHYKPIPFIDLLKKYDPEEGWNWKMEYGRGKGRVIYFYREREIKSLEEIVSSLYIDDFPF
ncbi:hypothetical protein [Thermococcus sp. AM4]|uniref:hypothetical protein n=1 Tax=Thermococcus sp. (strain AM4) TaxID=246969 RepID=UPI0001870987|nr:hypothetical protein [Thermococcus sp. AM4]EEB73712.1 hypothetical protein TAM4_1462 [Thermococcus sp. AM4]